MSKEDLDKRPNIPELLGKHGFFFEDACIESIKRNGKWLIETVRYPVEYQTGINTEIDIIAERAGQSVIFECKREDRETKNWIFIRSKDISLDKLVIRTYMGNLMGHDGKLKQWPNWQKSKWKITLNIDIFDSAFCIMPKKKGGNLQANPNPITDTCHQLIMGCCGLISERLSQMRKYMYGTIDTCYIPIIITTAKLSSFSYNVDNITLADGKLSEDGQLKQEKWLIYRWYSTLGILGDVLSSNFAGNSPKVIKDYHKVWDIIVVNSEHLLEFLENFCFELPLIQ